MTDEQIKEASREFLHQLAKSKANEVPIISAYDLSNNHEIIKGCHVAFESEPSSDTRLAVEKMIDIARERFSQEPKTIYLQHSTPNSLHDFHYCSWGVKRERENDNQYTSVERLKEWIKERQTLNNEGVPIVSPYILTELLKYLNEQ